MLGAAALTGLFGVATAPTSADVRSADDARLEAIGGEARDLLRRRRPLNAEWWAIPDTPGVFHAKDLPPGWSEAVNAVAAHLEPIDERLTELHDEAIGLVTTTLSAFKAKAMLAAWQTAIEHHDHGVVEPDTATEMAWSLFGDMLGENRA